VSKTLYDISKNKSGDKNNLQVLYIILPSLDCRGDDITPPKGNIVTQKINFLGGLGGC
jgi:hypothetical protein